MRGAISKPKIGLFLGSLLAPVPFPPPSLTPPSTALTRLQQSSPFPFSFACLPISTFKQPPSSSQPNPNFEQLLVLQLLTLIKHERLLQLRQHADSTPAVHLHQLLRQGSLAQRCGAAQVWFQGHREERGSHRGQAQPSYRRQLRWFGCFQSLLQEVSEQLARTRWSENDPLRLFQQSITTNDMKPRGRQNNQAISNVSTKRSKNTSRESTYRGKTMFDTEHSTCFSSPKHSFEQQHKYSLIHTANKEVVEEERGRIEVERNIKAAIVIQKYWRFHLLMRRRTHSLLIDGLEKDKQLWLRVLSNCQIQHRLLETQQSQLTSNLKHQAHSQLSSLKQLMLTFSQSSIKQGILLSSSLNTLTKELDYHQHQTHKLKDSILSHEAEVQEVLKRQKYFRDREESHILRINRLNKELLLVNVERSRKQLEVDQKRLGLKSRDTERKGGTAGEMI